MPGPEILIHEDAFVHNFRALQEISGRLAMMPVIKADAYGHSAEIIAKICESRFSETEVPYLVVARASEARALRERGVKRRLLVLSEFSAEDFAVGWPERTELGLSRFADLRLLQKIPASVLAGVHLNVNTGMNRLGFREEASLSARLMGVAESLKALGIPVTGLMSHLARGEEDPTLCSKEQEARFARVTEALRKLWREDVHGAFPAWIHLANSPGACRGVGLAGNAIRPGILLWGASPGGPWVHGKRFRPVAEVRAPIRQFFWVEAGEGVGYGHRFRSTRRSFIGTVPLGYADGIRRSLSRKADEPFRLGLVVEGRRVPIAGTVSMDLTMIDLTDHPSASTWAERCERGDDPEVLASWICAEQSADEIAEALGTIPYEVLCDMSRRVPRKRVGAA